MNKIWHEKSYFFEQLSCLGCPQPDMAFVFGLRTPNIVIIAVD